MYSFRRWFNKPKKTDTSLLASFFFADEELNSVAAELDSFDGRKDPERCTALVNKLRSCQDKVLVIIQKIIDEAIPVQKASRDFRVKFPDDVLQENLAGQLWFGAECLAAGSSIMNREIESASMRPLARALTKNLDSLRTLLRDQCFRDLTAYTDRINEALIIFDKLFAEFELSYVSTMVPVKSMREYDLTQEISVLFSETVQRALKEKLITQEMIDDYDPSLMFTIPRFAIICGLYVYPDGPLNPDQEPSNISEMFRPFQTLLLKIKELLQTLTESEMKQLEKSLCSSEDSSKPLKQNESSQTELALEEDCGPSTKLDINIHTLEGDECDVVESPTTPVAPAQHFPFPSEHSDGCTFPEGFTKESLDETLRNAIDETLRNSIGECQMRNSNLNKSESRDSGLHSENVSTSETISFDPNSVISVDALCTCAETSSGGQLSQQETTAVSNSSASEESICFRCNKRLQKETNTQTICSDIIHYLVETSLDICLSQSNVTNERQYSRQSSWQYNVNIEIPRSSELPDHENASSNSDSSTCTLSTSPSICDTLTFGASSMTSTLAGGVSSENTENSSPSLCDNTSHYSAVPIQASSVSPAVPSSSTLAVLSPLNPPDHSGHSHDKVASSNSVVNEDPLDIKPSASNQKGKSAQKTEKKSRKSIDRIHCKTGPIRNSSQDELQQEPSTPRIQRLRYPESVSSSFSSNHSTNYDSEWDRESGGSSETSSYNSESNDDEEIALAIKAAEVASKKEARSRFRSSSDLIHRLFVCISGVADQLQTNYAGDLRHILKCVFDMNCSEPLIMPDESTKRTAFDRSASFHTRASNRANRTYGHRPSYRARDPPQWTPDDQITVCLSCQSPFTFIRRKHHCRNCGKIYCGRCSANFVPLPHFGFVTPVRVCNRCLMYQVTPFTVND